MFSSKTLKALEFLDDEIRRLKAAGIYREPFVLESKQGPVSTISGRRVINLSSNNYLGLAGDPRVIKAARDAIERWGVGASAVRVMIGTMSIHEELERRLAAFKGTEACLVMPSGFATNVGVNQALMDDEKDMIISDKLNHASIIDGIRLSRGDRRVYDHCDMKQLEGYLKEARGLGCRRILVVTDGVFSVDGDIAPLPDIVELVERFDAMLMVDDAHASGVVGKNGRGTPAYFDLSDRVHLQIGTLSKAFTAIGGYCASTRPMRQFLLHRARPFYFSSALPPSVAATCLAVLDILEKDETLLERMWANTKHFKEGLKELGFDTGKSETPITPVMIGSTDKAKQMTEALFEEGVFGQAVVYPVVARGSERIRTIVTAGHSREELDEALGIFKKVRNRLGIVG